MSPTPVVVIDVVGLTPRLLPHAPRLAAIGAEGFTAAVEPPLPAVTCTAQASMLTGADPDRHGIVGNGWFFRGLGDPLLWRQHDRLVEAERIWDTARRSVPGYRVANLCWWYAMGARTDVVLTPRPVYHADGRKSPDCYTVPPSLRDELTAELGEFPLFSFWGPGAGISSSRWIAAAAAQVMERESPDLTLVYLPHLDYDLQRFGPASRRAVEAVRDIDRVAGRLAESARDAGATVVVVSEYGITPASRPVHVNRHLRRAGLLEVYEQRGMEYLDPWRSRAFAVADHQIAHVYVREAADLPRVRDELAALEGAGEVLEGEGRRASGLDHPRAGEIVLVAEPGAWFTYYYWLDDARAPDFARTVDIHRKPGYDPAELFLDPADRWVKARAGRALLRKRLGMRYVLDVVPLDPSVVRGTHGRRPDAPEDAPLLLCSDRSLRRDALPARAVRDLLLEAAGIAAPAPA
ncbi:MAG: alkaline phosphatase family protein [Thermoleophilia bacterium]